MIVLLNRSGKGRAEYKGCALDQRLLAMYKIMIQTVGAFSISIRMCAFAGSNFYIGKPYCSPFHPLPYLRR